jgi:hypothetical protein
MSIFHEDSESVQDSNSNNEPKTFQQWQQIRRTNPSGMGGYYSTKSQKLMMADRKALGGAWYA